MLDKVWYRVCVIGNEQAFRLTSVMYGIRDVVVQYSGSGICGQRVTLTNALVKCTRETLVEWMKDPYRVMEGKLVIWQPTV